MATLLVTMLSVIAAKAQTPYAVWCADNSTLYFTYSNETLAAGGKFTPEGASESIPITKVWSVRLTKNAELNNRSTQSWIGSDTGNATEVYIESNFKDVHPGDLYAWFQGFYKLKTIHGIENLIPAENATMDWMFKYCRSLEGLDLSKLQSSQVTRMEQTFSECKLDGLDFSKLNTGNVTSMGGMFINCKMTSLNLSQFNTSNVTNMSSMFWGCSNLSNLNLGGLNTEKVIYMNQMFKQCSNLTNLDLSNFNTLKVELMNEMFWGCSNLETLTLSSNFKTDNVNNMMSMFYGCSKLQSLDLTGFNTENVTNMETMFLDCSTLTSLDLTNFNTSNVTSMQGMFQRCTQLKSISFSNSFSCEKVTTMKEMFSGCSSLETLDLKCMNTLALQFTTNMFQNCEKLSGLDISTLNTSNVDIMSGMFSGCTSIEGLDLKNFTTSKVYWMNNMFENCVKLASLDVTSFNTENVTDMQNMFYGCKNLEGINLSNFNTAKVTKMIQMFYECKKLTRLDLSSFHTDCLQYISRMFYGCNSLEELNVSNFNTEKIDDMQSVFKDCYGLKTLDLSSFNTSAVTEMNYMFESCSNLVTLYVSDLWSTEKVQAGHGYHMFDGCARIVGGNGTVYCPDYTGESYAHIDVVGNPGYLTLKGNSSVTPVTKQAYAEYDNGTLTFYYKEEKTGDNIYPVVAQDGQSSSNGWSENKASIKKVVFDASFADAHPVATDAWFAECSELEEIEGFENLNTSDVVNMESMFASCGKLSVIDISNFNTSNVTNMASMFADCSSLTTIYVGENWSTSSVQTSNDMFTNSTNLVGGKGTVYNSSKTDYTYAHIDEGSSNPGYFTRSGESPYVPVGTKPYAVLSEDNKTLTFYYDTNKETNNGMDVGPFIVDANGVSSGWFNDRKSIETVVFNSSFADYHGLTSTSYWFYGLQNLKTITGIENLNTENVTDMQSMFYQCASLTALGLGHFDTSNVYYMDSMFHGCEGLTSLDVSKFTNSKVMYMGGMFEGCSSLTSLDLSDFDTQNVQGIGYMFHGCSSLTTIYVGEKWSVGDNVTSTGMFQGCTSLIGGQGTVYNADHTDHTYAHIDVAGNPGYLTQKSGNPIEPVGSKEPYAVLSNDNKTLTFYYDTNKEANNGMDVGPFTFNNGSVNSGWYNNRSSIQTVVFDKSFGNYHDLTSTAFWFVDFYGLQTITGIENLNTENVTSMKEMFYDCALLQSLDVSHFDTGNVEDMGYMFRNCSNLTSLDVRGFKTQKVKYMDGMFELCIKLQSLDLSNFNTENVTILSKMFNRCEALTSIDVSSFDTQKVERMEWMFSGCTGIESLNLSHFNPVGGVMTSMFEGCTSLKEVYLGGTSAEMTSMGSMFNGCSMLKTIYVGDNWNPGSSSYGTDTFKDCGNLVGGKGTVYDESHTGYTYAHIDGGTDNPGYFTGVGQTPSDPEDDFIQFKDAEVKRICVANWDTSGDRELSYREAKAVADLGKKFANNDLITSFDELQYFTGLKALNYQTGGQFDKCENLETITLPEGLEKIGEGTFNYCRKLKSLRIPASVTDMSYLGGWYYGMTEITVAEGNTKYDSRGNCNAVIETATNTLISGCNKTVIPDDVVAIGPFAFNACVTDSIAIPNSVTTIGKTAFSTCLFTGVGLPASITSIDEAAFSGCASIKHVTSKIAEPFAINVNTFTEDVYSTAILWVPTEKAIEKYQATDGWKKFQNIRSRSYTVEDGNKEDGQGYFLGLIRVNDDNTADITDVEDATGDVEIPATITLNGQEVDVTSIPDNAFANKSSITSVAVPASVANNLTADDMKRDGNGVFAGLSEQAVIVLPEVTNAQTLSAAAPNVVYKNGGSYKSEQVKLTDGEAYNAPAAITSIEAASVSYSRTFASGDVVYSICLPFAQPIPTGMKAYELEELNSQNQLVFKQASSIEAMKPYLITSAASVYGLRATSVTMNLAGNPTDKGVTGYDFCGTLKPIANSEASGCLILQSDKQWHPVGTKDIPANRAYLKQKANAARITGTVFVDDATSIKTIDADGTETYYDLQGRRIGKPQKGGIYVKNGKKVAVK